MDAGIVAALIGALATLFAVWLSHYLNQQSQQAEKGAPRSPVSSAPNGDRYAEEGLMALQARNYPAAIQALERAIEHGTNRHDLADVYTNLGTAQRELDRFYDALASYHKALARNPRHSQAWVGLGVTYRLTNNLVEAEKCYAKALAIDPDSADLHASLGVLAIMKGEPQQAVESLAHAIWLNPQNGTAHGNLALAYAMLGEFEAADTSLKQAALLGYANTAEIKQRIAHLKTL